MGKYIVELYVARGDEIALERGVERTRRAAERLTRAGPPARPGCRSNAPPPPSRSWMVSEDRP